MSWLKNQKISVKLTAGFSAALLGLIIISVLSIFGLSKLSDDAAVIARDRFPKTIWASNVINNINIIARAVRNVMLTDNAEDQKKEKARITLAESAINSYLDSLKNTTSTDKGRALLANINAPKEKYQKARSAMLDSLYTGGRGGALKLLFGDVRQSQADYLKAAEEIINYQNSKVHEAWLSSELTFSSVKIYLIMTGLVILVIVLILAFNIIRGIVVPVKLVKDELSKLERICLNDLGNALVGMSNGNVSLRVEKLSQRLNIDGKDEIGEMACVFNSMIDKVHSSIDSYEIVRIKIESLSLELKNLISDAKNGLLDSRGEINRFEGVYREIIAGLNQMLDAIILPVQDGSRVLEIMATGDFTERVSADYQGQHKVIKNSINKLGDSISEILRHVSEAVQATASASSQISSSSEEMAAGAQEQSSQTTEIAGAVEQMSKTILDTSRNSASASDAAKHAGSIANEGGVVVNQTIEGMQKIEMVVKKSAETVMLLGKSSNQIGEIVQVIDDIADQTNLLALNAAIEAARAGEQGRGFAVVADEVRKLAERTTKATKEIAEMIKRIQTDTKDAVESMKNGTSEVELGKELADKAGKSLKEIIKSSDEVVNIISQVAVASEEQSATAEQISKNIEGINNVAQESAAGVQQIARASEDLNRLTTNLQELILRFKIDQSSGNQFNNKLRENKKFIHNFEMETYGN